MTAVHCLACHARVVVNVTTGDRRLAGRKSITVTTTWTPGERPPASCTCPATVPLAHGLTAVLVGRHLAAEQRAELLRRLGVRAIPDLPSLRRRRVHRHLRIVEEGPR